MNERQFFIFHAGRPRMKSHKERYLDVMENHGIPNDIAEMYYEGVKKVVEKGEGFISYDDVARGIVEGNENALNAISVAMTSIALEKLSSALKTIMK